MSTSSSEQPSSTGRHAQRGEAPDGQARHEAGAFDIRNFIGGLIGIYGLVLLVYGLVGTSEAQLAKSGDININLLAGLGMVVVAAGFLLWAKLRPVVVPARSELDEAPGAADSSDMGRPPGEH